MPSFAVRAAGLFFNTIEKKAADIVTNMLQEKDVPVTVDRVFLQRDESGSNIESISCSLSEIDFGRLITMYLPYLEKKLTDEPTRYLLAEITSIVGTDGESMVRSMVDLMGEEKTTRILCALTKAYQDKICFEFNKKLQEKNLPLTVTCVEIE